MKSLSARYLGPLLATLLLSAGMTGCEDRFPPPTGTDSTAMPTTDKMIICRKDRPSYSISELTLGSSSEVFLGPGLLIDYDWRSRRMLILEQPFSQGSGQRLVVGYPDSARRIPLPGSGGEIIDAQLVAVAPKGEMVAYIVHSKAPRDSTWLRIFDMKTSSVKNLPLVDFSQGQGGYTKLSFSPDGKTLAFFGPTPLDPYAASLIIVPVDNPAQALVVPVNGLSGNSWRVEDDFACAWSPDGRRIAFVGEPDVHSPSGQVIVIDTNTWSIVHQMAESLRPYSIEIAWSADGKRLAATLRSLGDQQPDLWMLDVIGGDFKRLTNDSAEEHLPVWHSDRSRLSYVVADPFDYRNPGTLQSVNVLLGTRPSLIAEDVISAFWE